jgi:hypothetical protein
MAERIFWIKEGKPCFLDEKETGVFYPVIAFKGFDNPGYSEYEYDWRIGRLIIGHNIIEIPNRGVSIMLKTSESGFKVLSSIIHECIKIGEVSDADFVCLEHFGDNLGRLIGEESGLKIIEIRPRFFKKLEEKE